MIEIIEATEPIRWKKVVDAFPDPDVYYRLEYLRAFELHGDGSPILLQFSHNGTTAICAMMMRDIAEDKHFSGIIPHGEYFDLITPYGYGGFIFNHTPDAYTLNIVKEEFYAALKEMKIVSAFFRFHPMYKNADFHREMVNVIDLGKTIHIDLETSDLIWNNFTSKNRGKIRKAEKNGVEVKHAKDLKLFTPFMEIYNGTMQHDNATDYYYFSKEFYESIDKDLNDHYEMFYAEHQGKIIAMSIMLFDGQHMHYHLSGSRFEFRNLEATNILLYKAALWGNEHGLKSLHLGGGVGSSEDSLLKFKEGFNRQSDNQFSIGKLIVDKEKYDELINLRNEVDLDFNKESKFFPTYRS